MKILITGVYGFIGFSTALRLLTEGHEVYGVDKIQDAISPKEARKQRLAQYDKFHFAEVNLIYFSLLDTFMEMQKFDIVLHFAGQYSVINNDKTLQQYFEGNIEGYFNILRASYRHGVKRFIYASSTFVQDGQTPDNMYACTKVFNEHLANVYSCRFNMETVGLRFGSTYGPYIRPDVGLYQIAKKLYADYPIDVSHPAFTSKIGFLFIDDGVECVIRAINVQLKNKHNVCTLVANDYTADLMDMLVLLRNHTAREPKLENIETWETKSGNKIFREMPKGRVPTEKCKETETLLGYCPVTTLQEGIIKTIPWFDKYFSNAENLR